MHTALYAPEGGKPGPLSTEAEMTAALKEPGGCLWVDFEAPSDDERSMLARIFGFHKLALENCFAQTNHPRIDDYGDYLYVIVHGVVWPGHEGSVEEYLGQLRKRDEERKLRSSRITVQEIDVFLGKNFLVTYHHAPDLSIEHARKRCNEVKEALRRGPDRLLAEILDHLADEYVTVMEALDVEIDWLEDRLFKRASKPALREIFSLKKDVLHLRRIVNPQREVLNRLARNETPLVSPEEALFFRDVYDHIYRVSEMLESFRDVLTGAMEVYLTVVSNRTNEIVKVLTIVSIILMTGSLVAGLYGMNVPLPGQGENAKGTFYVILLVLAVFSGGLLWIFRKRRWI